MSGPLILALVAWLAFWAAVVWFSWKVRRIVEGKDD